MALVSSLFCDVAALQACLVDDAAHLTLGSRGEHVARVQFALFILDGAGVEPGEIQEKSYGESTAAAVLAYKTSRDIVNRAYQSTPDAIVGKMTIAALDRELVEKQGRATAPDSRLCGCDAQSAAGREGGFATLAFASPSSPPQSQFALVQQVPGAGGGAAAPRDKALAHVGDARDAVKRTRAVLFSLINFKPVGVPVVPQTILANFDRVWRNFGVPKFPVDTFGAFPTINNLTDFLNAIDSTYARMDVTLADANARFRDIDQATLGSTTFALTLTTDRVPGDPTGPAFPNGIYFGSLFASSTAEKQTEVVIHESAHFRDGHLIGDPFRPDSPNWGKFGGDVGLMNAWSYSMFTLDAVFGRTTPFP